MLKPQTESSQLLERLKHLLSISNDCKVKSDIKKKWNNNVDLLLKDANTQIMTRDLSKLSNNSTKLNMLIVSTENCNYL